VASFLKITQFNSFKLVAGKSGITRDIKTVTVIDNLSGWENWLYGGELVLSSGFFWRDNPEELEYFIRKLYTHNAACLCIKIGRFLDHIPSNVIKVSDELSIPIITHPINYGFVDILIPTLSTILKNRELELLKSYKINKSLTNMVANGASISQIIDALQIMTNVDFAFVSPSNNECFHSSLDDNFKNNITKLPLEENLRLYNCEELKFGRNTYGYLFQNTFKKDTHSTPLFLKNSLIHGCTILKLNLQQKVSNRNIERRYKDELFFDLLLNRSSIKEVSTLLKNFFEWTPEDKFFVSIIRVESNDVTLTSKDDFDNITNVVSLKITKNIKELYGNAFSATLAHSIITISSSEKELSLNLRKKLEEQLSQLFNEIELEFGIKLIMGVGGVYDDADKIRKSYKEAQEALNLGHHSSIVFFDELGVQKLLHSLPLNELRSFFNNYLEEVLDYDKKHNLDLLKTLAKLVENNWNYRRTAKILGTHHNTVKYRVDTIQKLSGLSLDDHEDRLNIALSMRIYLNHL